MSPPRLYDRNEVLKRLELKGYELEGLLNIGIVAPVACGAGGQGMYCAETIDRLAPRSPGTPWARPAIDN